ncbi:MAG: hypothetical protein V4735_00390 [Pseudomonadota bacterium]
MIVRVNKKISSSQSVEYAALSTGTISHVWYDDDSRSIATPKRQNHIRMTRDTMNDASRYDA